MIKKILKRIPAFNELFEFPLIRKSIDSIRAIANLRLTEGPLTYNEDGLATSHNCDFMTDPLFMESYRLGKATHLGAGSSVGSEVGWRTHVICWAASHAKNLEGDFVECGVNRGWFSRAAMQYVDFKRLNKKFYLLDTFCGFSEKYILKEERDIGRLPGKGYEECYENVKETFREFSNVKIIRGPVPETLSQVDAAKVAYLSIDMNCVMPEIAAAEFFWNKLVKGAVVILDDYGWKAHILQKKAFDKFTREKGVEILSLPTGQGLIFKP